MDLGKGTKRSVAKACSRYGVLWQSVVGVMLFSVVATAQIIIFPPHPPTPPMPPREPRPIPIPPPRPQFVPVELRQHKVEAQIKAGNATTSVEMAFFNPNSVQAEGDFMFGVPGNAAIHDLVMWMNGKEVKAELLSADEARRIYEETVRRVKDPALLEIAGDRLIRARVFPIPPGGEQRIRIKYSYAVPAEAGLYTFTYPLRVRGGGLKPPQKVTVLVQVDSPSPIKSILSPTHKIDVVAEGDKKAKVSYEGEKNEQEKDFVLYIATGDKDVGVKVLSFRDKGKDGFFMALVGAGYESAQDDKPMDKAVLFVIDTSGSMAEDGKIDQVRKALKYCLDHLNSGDKFNIVDFSTTARKFRDQLVPAEKAQLEDARKYANALEARGGTAIHDALKAVVELGRDVTMPFMVIFLTDGKPTIGTDDTEQLVNTVKGANLKNLRLFVFGAGYDVNAHLLDRLAQEDRGASSYVLPGEDIEQKVVALHQKISYPAFSDVSLKLLNIRTYDLFPAEMPDLFRGSVVTVLGRYEGSGDKAIELTGTMRGGRKTVTYEGTFTADDTSNDWLPRMWATRKVGYLLDQIRLKGEKQELKEEVIRLSKEFGIITPYTSFLVIEDERVRPRGPASMPSPAWGVRDEALKIMHGDGDAFARRFNAAEGKAGVETASEVGALKSALPTAPKPADREAAAGAAPALDKKLRDLTREAGGKTFYLVDGRWLVSTWDGKQETTKVKYLSDDYFDLVRKYKALREAFALGTKVVAECDGKFYEVIE
jgi:Ca-activated chloride channel homolog